MSELSPALGLSHLELASGYVGGVDESTPRAVPSVAAGLTPLAALEQAVLPAFERGRCFVSFSGGRDSSAVLAAAAAAARRHGLDPPIPVSLRFRGSETADESEWQELLVRHLGLDDWIRLEFDDELDYVGPVAAAAHARHGVLYPFNAHFHAPVFEQAAGGTVFTGSGGDDLFLAWRWQREAWIASGRARPRLRDLPRFAYFAAPLALRRAAVARITGRKYRWLSPLGRRRFAAAVAGDADEPRRFDARTAWLSRRRYRARTKRSFDLLAADAGARCETPLLEPRFLSAVARAGGRSGFGDRTAAMRALFGTLLPDELLARPTKAVLTDAFLGEHTAAFLRGWDGTTPFPDLIDTAGLRAAWAPGENLRPRLLLQATALAARRR